MTQWAAEESSPRGGERDPPLSRRRFLAAAGTASAGVLAGCGTDEGDVVHSRTVFGHALSHAPESVQLNPWPGTSYPYDFYTLLYEPLSLWVPGEGRRLTDVVADLTHGGGTATLTLNEEFSWWNGDPVTARDRWVYERLQSAVGEDERPAVEQVDEYTLRYEFDGEPAEPVVTSHVAGDTVNTAAWLFERWVDRFDAVSTDSAHGDLVEEFHEWRIPLERAMDEGFGNGPYELSEVSLARVMLEAYPDHPRAADISVPRLWFPVLQSGAREDFIVDGRIDGGRGRLSQLGETPPDFIEQFDTFQTTNGTKLVLHWDHPDLSRRAVREAILAVVSLEQVVDVGNFGDVKAVQTGLAEPAERQWLGDHVDEFRRRPVEADVERGVELMQSADYSRDGTGKWRRPDDGRVRIRLRSPIWSAWKFAAEVVRDALTSFGFEVNYSQIPDNRLISDVREYAFDAMLWPSDARAHAVYDVTSDFASTLGYGVTDPETETGLHDKPVTVTLESGETVNLVEAWERLRTADDDAATRTAVATFARWWNEALPDLQLATQVSAVWGNTRDYDWPAADGTTYRAAGPGDRPEYRLLTRGLVEPADD